jgi:endopeptidase Clp ATP-binding regulatory subunit ClpX
MATEHEPKGPPDDWQRQIQDWMRQARLSAMPFAAPEPSPTKEPAPDEAERTERLKRILEFNLKPREIRDYLDRFVVRQDEAKKVLAVAICDHYNHVRQCRQHPELREKLYAKPNIILLGPTGVGKTYLVRCLAKLVGVPFVKADATKFSETGYVGHDVEDLVRDLVKSAQGDVDLAQYGIIYLDEIDKIAASPNLAGRDVSGRGVQVNLLKLMEETDVPLQSQTDLLGQVEAIFQLQRSGKAPVRTLNTRHILFIVSGAFDRLPEVIKRRVQAGTIGFARPGAEMRADSDFLPLAQTQDFIGYGFEPEFIGRLPVRVTCSPLGPEDLRDILLNSEDSVLAQYRRDLEGYGIRLTATTEAIDGIARLAHKEQTGARGLMTVLERLLRDFKFELPSTAIKSLEITTDTLEAPRRALETLLAANRHLQEDVLRSEIRAFADRFEQEHGLTLTFDDGAVDALVTASVQRDKTIRALCGELFRDFHHGLKLVANNTGRTSFTVTRAVIEAPDRELSAWIVESFKSQPPTQATGLPKGAEP